MGGSQSWEPKTKSAAVGLGPMSLSRTSLHLFPSLTEAATSYGSHHIPAVPLSGTQPSFNTWALGETAEITMVTFVSPFGSTLLI